MTFRATLSRLHARAASAMTAIVVTLVSTAAVAQDTTGVGAIGGVVVDASGRPAEGRARVRP